MSQALCYLLMTQIGKRISLPLRQTGVTVLTGAKDVMNLGAKSAKGGRG